jgi:prefoldin alpha subunit
MINASMAELDIVLNTLDEIKNNKKEILVPIGGDSFVSAKIIDAKKVLIGLGSDVSVKKTIPDAKTDLKARLKELEVVRKDIIEKLGSLLDRIEQLSPQVRSIVEGEKGVR